MKRGLNPRRAQAKEAAPALLEFKRTKRFEVDLALARATPRYAASTREIWRLLELLRRKDPIPGKYHPHKMKGRWNGWWNCHLDGDFVLIWRHETELDKRGEPHEYVMLAAVGSHAYLKIA